MSKRVGAMLVFTAVVLFPGRLWARGTTAEVPFELYRNYAIVVRGSIGELRKLHFLIDTGMSNSLVNERIARKLGLSGRTQPFAVVTEAVRAQRVVLPVVQIGTLRAESLPALVRDLSFIEEGLGTPVDAMIGVDVLGSSNFSIDYKSRKICFAPVEWPDRFERAAPFLFVQMLIDNRPFQLLLDTGAKDVVLFEARVRGRLPRLRIQDEKTSRNLAGSEVRLKRVRLPNASLGAMHLKDQEAFLVETPAHVIPEFDGLLGVAALKLSAISFDFERKLVRLRK